MEPKCTLLRVLDKSLSAQPTIGTEAIVSNIWQVLADWQDSIAKESHSLLPLISTDVVSQGEAVLPQDGVQMTAGVTQLEDEEAKKGHKSLPALFTRWWTE